MMDISGLIITHNEEKNIREVLECFDFCSEIVVVDSFSTDKTVEIAKEFPNTKIIQNPFEDFTKQRNLALDAASNDWVLFLDGDERITPELRREIIAELNKPEQKDAYYFYRKFFFAQKPIHFSGTQSDKNFRLFRKSKARYMTGKKVHETLEVNGNVGVLKNKLLHYSVSDYESYRKKMIHYGILKGKELAAKGKKFNVLVQYLKTAFKFFKAYIMRLGILDGKEGYQLSYLQSLSVFETYESLKKEQN
ncbi:glycosyl transferase [Chryseobacterium sp. P1-3]|uniref:Glycosyl transferase n=1 Tax=Chryseobacterium gallinarum TaxID=1324352 RepID=A0A0G3LZY5_CHRGL|nr:MULTISPECIES: glycosyltransferase family 2 protein [Chryseobacterium]AKK72179.1 glycosyl transferase [Chryseobacterium gallinarum]KFF75926.1 glycosyl transferase [Chryseobacterium sp. P1-3]MCL8535751.1 glycosyltransferase family 2 protein [Chryseobacterium gallinarum]QIY92109.1 glycosyltransferase family 2 protein [Chryseobacterium gallinarum]